jgi:hypothetical protein
VPKTNSTYLHQFARVARWHDRLREVNADKRHDRDTILYEDDLYAFFMNCYHPKDWIKADSQLRAAGKGRNVELAVKANVYMQVCGGICNGEKHFGAPRAKAKPNAHVQSTHFKIDIAQGTIAIDFNVDTGGTLGTVQAFDLATKCMDFWKDYIDKVG